MVLFYLKDEKDLTLHMEEKKSFSDYLRLWFKWVTDPLGAFFNKIGLKPNTMTILGVSGTALGAFLIANGNMLLIQIKFIKPSF